MKDVLQTSLKSFVKVIMTLLFRPVIIGQENIPKNGKFVVYSNHISIFDGPLFVAFFNRPIAMMAKKELWKIPPLVPFLKLFGVINVDRKKAKANTFHAAGDALNEGKLVGGFPEGTRYGMAKNKPLKAGVILIAEQNEATFIPVRIEGKYNIFIGVRAIIGEPFKLEKTGREARSENLNILMKNILKIGNPTNEKVLIKHRNHGKNC